MIEYLSFMWLNNFISIYLHICGFHRNAFEHVHMNIFANESCLYNIHCLSDVSTNSVKYRYPYA